MCDHRWLLLAPAAHTRTHSNHCPRRQVRIDYKYKFLELGGTQVRLEIWDFEERWQAIRRACLRSAHGIMCVYDITDAKSVEHAPTPALRQCWWATIATKKIAEL